MAKADAAKADDPVETRLHRLRVGDRVTRELEGVGAVIGEITAITNQEGTYVLVKFDDDHEIELTEEEVRRTP